MHSQLGTPATVLAKNAQVATGDLQLLIEFPVMSDHLTAWQLTMYISACPASCCFAEYESLADWHVLTVGQDIHCITRACCILVLRSTYCTLTIYVALSAGSTLNTLLTVPFSKKRKRDSDDLRRHTKTSQSQNGRPLSPSHYAVSLEQMQANKYPLPEVTNDGQMTCPAGFVATQPAGKLQVIPKLLLWMLSGCTTSCCAAPPE